MLRSVSIAAQAQRAFVIGGVSDALFRVYERVGVRGTGIYFRHGALNDNAEQLVYWDVASTLKGENVRPDLWRDIPPSRFMEHG